MTTYERSHLSDPTLLRDLATHLARERADSAVTLADLAEVDERKLYLPAGFPSMYAYCVGALHLCEQAAYKRIAAARAARRFPAIFPALAEGRLHLSAIVLLAPHLTEENVGELLAAATHRSKGQIEQLLAERFPRPDLISWVAALPGSPSEPVAGGEDPEPVGTGGPCAPDSGQEGPGPVRDPVACQLSPGRVGGASTTPRSTVKPLAPGRFGLQCTIGRSTEEKLRYAQELLSHQVPGGDLPQLLDRVLDAAIPVLERQRFAATSKPRPARGRASRDSRHIPADVKRAVWERDGGRCTFVSGNGHRCEARTRLEFDHVDAYARGGAATVSGIRLLCRAHNRFEAERTYGPEFMRHKRLAAAEARAAAKARAAAAARRARDQDVVPWLLALGFSATEAKNAATRCHDLPEDAPLEERVRVALSSFRVRGMRVERAVSCHEPARSPAAPIPPGCGP